jgi:hypothetical protein
VTALILLRIRQIVGDDRRIEMTNSEPCLAHTIEGTARISKCGRTKIYGEIKLRNLKARKIGRRTIILDEDLRRWLASLPMREVA